MREIIFDTETTGLSPADGDRIIEIGAIELFNHVPTGRTFHQYLNPVRVPKTLRSRRATKTNTAMKMRVTGSNIQGPSHGNG
jgi:DNA polymerase III epsilon subunit-like protein